MPEPRKARPSDAEFEEIMASPPRGGFSAWKAAQLTGEPYKRILDAMKAGQIKEVWDLGHIKRLSPKIVRKLREMSPDVLKAMVMVAVLLLSSSLQILNAQGAATAVAAPFIIH